MFSIKINTLKSSSNHENKHRFKSLGHQITFMSRLCGCSGGVVETVFMATKKLVTKNSCFCSGYVYKVLSTQSLIIRLVPVFSKDMLIYSTLFITSCKLIYMNTNKLTLILQKKKNNNSKLTVPYRHIWIYNMS
jgi:hypothetical protein